MVLKIIVDDKFVYYRDLFLYNEIAMCYNAAMPSVWSDVFNITSTDHITRDLLMFIIRYFMIIHMVDKAGIKIKWTCIIM